MKFISTAGALIFFLALAQFSVAQQVVTGNVFDKETNEPLPGVSVFLKGTTKGVPSNIDGVFSLELTDEEIQNDTLVFRFLGYQELLFPIEGNTKFDVFLSEDSELLDEVVITAIGIEKDKRKLGYSVTEVESDEIIKSRETNIINALNAKVAGVQVTSTSGSPGASSVVRIRGNTSINGNNEPLYVIDGISIDNSYRGSNFTDQANRAIDIDPNDIESMTVLKGGAASVLYGLRAANGAIIINTKKGRKGKTSVTFSSTTTFDVVNKLPERQSTYAQGDNGQFIQGSNFSWGPRIDNLFYALDTTNGRNTINRDRLVFGDDLISSGEAAESFENSEDFFETGVTLNNSLSITGGNEKSTFYLGLADLRQTGIVPLTEFNRTSIRLTGTNQITDNFHVRASANYITSKADRAQRGSNLSGVMLGLMRTPASYDLTNGSDDPVEDETAWLLPDGTQRTYHGAYDNPYWSVNRNRNEEKLNRLIGFVEANWQPFEWMNVMNRTGVDTYSEQRKSYWDRQSNEFTDLGGAIFDENFNQRNITNDLIVTIDHEITSDFNAQYIVGHSFQDFNSTSYVVDGFDFVVDDFYDMSNVASINVTADDFLDRRRIIGLFGDFSFDYKRTYYLTLTGRNDWSSTLPADNNSFFYPSVSLGFVPTEIVELGPLEYVKLRGSYAVTGNDAFASYLTSNFFVSGGSTQGQLSYFPSSLIGSNDLSPEFTNSFEIGTDIRSRNNRVGLDFTYYNTSSRDQIVEIPIANSTGYSSVITNIGEIQNQGFEVLLNVNILERKVSKPNKVWWNSSINFTRNRSEVIELTNGLDNIALPSNGLASTQSRVIVGEQYGVLFGSVWERNENGDVLVDSLGNPLAQLEGDIIGDPNPDFTMGWRNNIGWRNWELTFLLDIRVGGDVYNGTRAVMTSLGTHADTEDRDEEIIVDGVFSNGTRAGQVNDVAIRKGDLYSNYGLVNVSEEFVEEVNWIRMRDVSLTYSFSPAFLSKIGIERASLSLTARNLFLITNYTGIDPETSLGGGSNAFGRDYFNNPNTTSYGFNLTVAL
ncbi:MAG: SusC/RagA family TonB-linked outer membrane protein [Flavobacteriales bacterium]|nr:SusC/RagA family TonB-linked outer membrane protein [Flavobacteriales bacterium]